MDLGASAQTLLRHLRRRPLALDRVRILVADFFVIDFSRLAANDFLDLIL